MRMPARVVGSPGKEAQAQILQADSAQVWTKKNVESIENEDI